MERLSPPAMSAAFLTRLLELERMAHLAEPKGQKRSQERSCQLRTQRRQLYASLVRNLQSICSVEQTDKNNLLE